MPMEAMSAIIDQQMLVLSIRNPFTKRIFVLRPGSHSRSLVRLELGAVVSPFGIYSSQAVRLDKKIRQIRASFGFSGHNLLRAMDFNLKLWPLAYDFFQAVI